MMLNIAEGSSEPQPHTALVHGRTFTPPSPRQFFGDLPKQASQNSLWLMPDCLFQQSHPSSEDSSVCDLLDLAAPRVLAEAGVEGDCRIHRACSLLSLPP